MRDSKIADCPHRRLRAWCRRCSVVARAIDAGRHYRVRNQRQNPDAYEDWLPAVQKTIADAGGQYLGGGFNKTTTMTGDPPPNRVVVIQYPSVEAAKKWWQENDTEAIRKAEKFASFRIYAVEGIEKK